MRVGVTGGKASTGCAGFCPGGAYAHRRLLAVVPLGTPDVSIVVPVYNTKLEYLVDLMASIGQSIVQPNEVIFIDDGSDDEHARDLAELVEHRRNIGRVVL